MSLPDNKNLLFRTVAKQISESAQADADKGKDIEIQQVLPKAVAQGAYSEEIL